MSDDEYDVQRYLRLIEKARRLGLVVMVEPPSEDPRVKEALERLKEENGEPSFESQMRFFDLNDDP